MGKPSQIKTIKAVFLDRDGVLNRLVMNPQTGTLESPHRVEDLDIFSWVPESLNRLKTAGFHLFLISNQPSYAKGKTTLESIQAIQNSFQQQMERWNIPFTKYFYCYHHPNGIVKDLAIRCQCRKPGTLFLEQARDEFHVHLSASWLVGDRDSDMICGKNAGTKTIFILEGQSGNDSSPSQADYSASNLADAVEIILREVSK